MRNSEKEGGNFHIFFIITFTIIAIILLLFDFIFILTIIKSVKTDLVNKCLKSCFYDKK